MVGGLAARAILALPPCCCRAAAVRAREGRSGGRSDPKAFLDALRAPVGRSQGRAESETRRAGIEGRSVGDA